MNNKIKRHKDGYKNGYWEETSEDGSITKAYYKDGNLYGLVETKLYFEIEILFCTSYIFTKNGSIS